MKILETRNDFIEALPKNCTIAEVGVCGGENAKNIYKICRPTELVLIDMWSNETAGVGKVRSRPDTVWEHIYESIVNHFSHDNNIKIIRRFSLDAVQLFENNYFDWIYIDASHLYEDCYADLNAWFPKVKVGGYICGHDYSDTENTRRKNFGVKRAVDQFLEENNLEIEFISGNSEATDYAIKKVSCTE